MGHSHRLKLAVGEKLCTPFSPLFIGDGSFTEQSRRRRIRDLSFSPLFIGDGSFTAGGALGPFAFLAFSPLFIGDGSFTFLVGECNGFVVYFQSPLHRGRVIHFIARGLAAAQFTTFQSPLHRGRVIHSFSDLTGAPSSSFSPLFIGDGSFTFGTSDEFLGK